VDTSWVVTLVWSIVILSWTCLYIRTRTNSEAGQEAVSRYSSIYLACEVRLTHTAFVPDDVRTCSKINTLSVPYAASPQDGAIQIMTLEYVNLEYVSPPTRQKLWARAECASSSLGSIGSVVARRPGLKREQSMARCGRGPLLPVRRSSNMCRLNVHGRSLDCVCPDGGQPAGGV
jgi:hypothetical protein